MNDTPASLIIPTLLLRANATLPESNADKPGGYTINFGEFENASIKTGGDIKEVFRANGGALGLQLARRVKNTLTYEADLKHLAPAALAYLMGSASGQAPRPGKVHDLFFFAALQMEGEPVVGSGNSNEGAGVLVHHSFKGALTLEGDLNANGEDFAMGKLTVRVYLGQAPGVWTAAARPVTPVPSGG